MKKLFFKIFFGVVLLGSCNVRGAFESLKTRSPFGDARPKPQPVVAKTPSEKKPAAPAPQKKDDRKLMFTSIMELNGRKVYSIQDRTNKDMIYVTLEDGKTFSSGKDTYRVNKYDPGKRVLTLEINGSTYPCKLGEESQDAKNKTATGERTSNSGGSSSSSRNDWLDDDDDWDWWDDDDWDDWD